MGTTSKDKKAAFQMSREAVQHAQHKRGEAARKGIDSPEIHARVEEAHENNRQAAGDLLKTVPTIKRDRNEGDRGERRQFGKGLSDVDKMLIEWHPNSPLAKSVKHLNKETERGEHRPEVGGHKDHNHSGS